MLGRRSWTVLLTLLLLPAPWPGGPVAGAAQAPSAQGTGAEGEIRATWTALDERWNARDAEGFSALFHPEARFVFVDRGESLDGRDQILLSFADRFPTFAPELRHRTAVQEVRQISSQVAVVDGGVEILRIVPEQGAEPVTILTFAVFAVMAPSEEGWRIRELRVFELPLSPEP